MKQNPYVIISSQIVRTLVIDPQRSNRSIADEFGVSEAMVRKQRNVLELAGILAVARIRVGSDGVHQQRSLA